MKLLKSKKEPLRRLESAAAVLLCRKDYLLRRSMRQTMAETCPRVRVLLGL